MRIYCYSVEEFGLNDLFNLPIVTINTNADLANISSAINSVSKVTDRLVVRALPGIFLQSIISNLPITPF